MEIKEYCSLKSLYLDFKDEFLSRGRNKQSLILSEEDYVKILPEIMEDFCVSRTETDTYYILIFKNKTCNVLGAYTDFSHNTLTYVTGKVYVCEEMAEKYKALVKLYSPLFTCDLIPFIIKEEDEEDVCRSTSCLVKSISVIKNDEGKIESFSIPYSGDNPNELIEKAKELGVEI